MVDAAPPWADPSPGGVVRRYRLVLGPGKVRLGASVTGDERERGATPRGEVAYWSSRSRLRMVETMCSLDWAPVVDPQRPGWRPGMVTLTLPGRWLDVAPTGADFKRILDRFRVRWVRKWGSASWVWKLEFQRRGAPHLHIYTALHAGREFAEWMSLAWTSSVFGIRPKRREGESWGELVARVHATYGGEVGRSLEAGTGVDWAQGIAASDPKRAAVYFLKRATGHNLGPDKEYQHIVPEAWREDGAGPGRFWGYYGLDKCEVQVELDDEQFWQFRRLLRRWAKANGRPVRSLFAARMQGGMVLANDAPGLVAQATRWAMLSAGGDVRGPTPAEEDDDG